MPGWLRHYSSIPAYCMKTSFRKPTSLKKPDQPVWLKRFISACLLALVPLGMMAAPFARTASARPAPAGATHLVISEFRFDGSNGASDEFVEIYNPTGGAQDISGWRIRGANNAGSVSSKFTFGSGIIIQPGQHYLIVGNSFDDVSGPYDGALSGITADGGAALALADNTIIDSVALSAGAATALGAPLIPATATGDQSYERLPGGANGNCEDNDVPGDFVVATSSPETSASAPVYACVPATSTPTHTATLPPLLPTPEVYISEVAWSGTNASNTDEWIELTNSTASTIDISNWELLSDDGSPSILLSGFIPAGGTYLLERTDNDTISNITVDSRQIYTGDLVNAGETLRLQRSNGTLVDSANIDGGLWPDAATAVAGCSMYRSNPGYDSPLGWTTSTIADNINGALDAQGNLVCGSPENASLMATNTPGVVPDVYISEIAWMGTEASSSDEWIELRNSTSSPISLTGWQVVATDGTPIIQLYGQIPANGYYLLERGSNEVVSNVRVEARQIYSGALEDGGEALYLVDNIGNAKDSVNIDGGSWSAGSSNPKCSMYRSNPGYNDDQGWSTSAFNSAGLELDRAGNIICGTPKNNAFIPTETPTASNTPTASATLMEAGKVYISEVGWMGTMAYPGDEWIELHNSTASPVNVQGWRLVSKDGSPYITLQGIIPPDGYYLLEANNDFTIRNIPVEPRQIYNGLMDNTGETLLLFNPRNDVMDTANIDGGAWPAGFGNQASKCSMVRVDPRLDNADGWKTSETTSNAEDQKGNKICGSPHNSAFVPTDTPTPSKTPTPSRTPTNIPSKTLTRTPTRSSYRVPVTSLVLNEFMPYPRTDWNKDGKVDSGDEYVEIMNVGKEAVNMFDWDLDDQEGDSNRYNMKALLLQPGAKTVLFGADTKILLGNSLDSVRLFNTSSVLVDAFSYTRTADPDIAWCRLPDGEQTWVYNCAPTPGEQNQLAKEIGIDSNILARMCASPTLPEEIRQAECPAIGLQLWSRILWDGLQPYFQYWMKHGDENIWVE